MVCVSPFSSFVRVEQWYPGCCLNPCLHAKPGATPLQGQVWERAAPQSHVCAAQAQVPDHYQFLPQHLAFWDSFRSKGLEGGAGSLFLWDSRTAHTVCHSRA